MSLVKYYTKGVLSNRNLWFWGVAIMIFWLVIGAYSFSQGVPHTSFALTLYTADWYSTIGMYSLSALTISVAYSIYYASSSIVYCFRYTRLTPLSYIETLLASSSAIGILLNVIMLVATFGLFSERFGLSLPPNDPAGAIGVSALAGLFMMAFAMLLVLIVVNYVGLQSTSLLTFIPLILAFGFGYTQLVAQLPIAILYASPYSAIDSLLYETYSGRAATSTLTNSGSASLQWPYLLVSLVMWIGILIIVDSYLIRRLRPRQIEEARQI